MIERTERHTRIERYRPIVEVLLTAFGDRLRTAVLFGSQARGDAHADSDHDILIVVAGLPRDPLVRNRLVRSPLLPILAGLPGTIAFTARTPEEFQSNLTPLLLDVCSDGICLYGADYFEPYRRKALAALERSGLRQELVGNLRMWLFPKFPMGDWELTWEGFREGI